MVIEATASLPAIVARTGLHYTVSTDELFSRKLNHRDHSPEVASIPILTVPRPPRRMPWDAIGPFQGMGIIGDQ